MCVWFFFFFFKQKTAYEMRISDWSSDVCSSDLALPSKGARLGALAGFSAMQGLSPVWSGEQGMKGMGNEGNGCSKAIGGRRNSAAIPLIPYSPYSPSLLPVFQHPRHNRSCRPIHQLPGMLERSGVLRVRVGDLRVGDRKSTRLNSSH